VCYGRGSTRPTVTDANVVLGRINADKPIGGKLVRLDVEAAKAAIEKHVSAPLGLDVMAGAEAIIRVANSKMAGAIRLVSIERGHDPKQFAAMPFGGGGALHTGALIKEVGLQSALVPRYPGINSALGCTIADMRHDFVQTVNGMLDGLDMAELGQRMAELAQKGLGLLADAGVAFGGTDVLFEMDMSYQGQTHTVDVPLPVRMSKGGVAVERQVIHAAFEARYRAVYGRPLNGIAIRVLNLRVSAIGRRPRFDLTLLAPAPGVTLEDARTGTRQVWIDGAYHETVVLDRLPLSVGVQIPGPAILEQPDATIFIEPDLIGRVDPFGNLIISRKEGS
jgi:N-methylhydantoinase A